MARLFFRIWYVSCFFVFSCNCAINPYGIMSHIRGFDKVNNVFFLGALQEFSSAYRGFSKIGNLLLLGNQLFGSPIYLQDIYLASKLSAEGLLIGDDSQAYGGKPAEQYIGQFAKTELLFDASKEEQKTTVYIGIKKPLLLFPGSVFAFGCNGSYIRRKKELNISIKGGKPGVGNILGEDNIRQYFKDYNVDFCDFLRRAVFEPKGLMWQPTQVASGLSSIDVWGELAFLRPEWTDPVIEAVSFGLMAKLPGDFFKKTKIKRYLWDISLDQGLGLSLGVFANMDLFFDNPYVNPSFFFSVERMVGYMGKFAAVCKKNEHSCIDMPKNFQVLTIQPFSLQDACCHDFSDKQYRMIEYPAPLLRFVFTNTFYRIFNTRLSALLGLEYLWKNKSKFHLLSKVSDSVDLHSLSYARKFDLLRLTAMVSFVEEKDFVLRFGWRGVVFGSNCLEDQGLVLSLDAAF